MKKNKIYLISAMLFTSYAIYITYSYINFYLKKETYGNVYYDMFIYPHYFFLVLGIIFNYILYFKDTKWLKIATLICYILSLILLFIPKF